MKRGLLTAMLLLWALSSQAADRITIGVQHLPKVDGDSFDLLDCEAVYRDEQEYQRD